MLAISGMIFAVVGLTTGNRLVIWAAIALLGVSFAIRLYLRRR